MDPLGTTLGVLGLAGLFSVCLDIMEKVEAYKDFGTSSLRLSIRFKTEKVKFEEWAHNVGIEEKGLSKNHHPRLDDEKIAGLVEDVMASICQLFVTSDHLSHKMRLPSNSQVSNSGLGLKNLIKNSTMNTAMAAPSVSTKLKGVFLHVSKLTNNITELQTLIESLYLIVPPDGDFGTQIDSSNLAREIRLLLDDHRNEIYSRSLRRIDELLDSPKIRDELQTHSSRRLENTCDWIFRNDIYQRWLSTRVDEPGPAFLWFYGPAGFGKSILCSKIIESLRESHGPFVFHAFSSLHARSRGTPEDIIRIWISQIARIDQSSLDLVGTCLESRNSAWALTAFDIWDAFSTIVLHLGHCVFVLDGLDEYEGSDAVCGDFILNLKQSLKQTSSLVFVMSRDKPEIRAQFAPNNDISSTMVLLTYGIKKDDVATDISLFSRHIVEQKLPKKNANSQDDLISQLTERCDGMFLWVRLVGERFRGTLSSRQLQNIMNDVPAGLDSAYARNWMQILRGGKYDRERGLGILRWCLFAIRPLTVQELTVALIIESLEEGDEFDSGYMPDTIDDSYIENEIKDLCGSLVNAGTSGTDTDPALRTVQLMHSSVKEYLLSDLPGQVDRDGASHVKFGLQDHVTLAKVCLRYLCNVNSDECNEGAPENEKTNTFSKYAIENWTVHGEVLEIKDASFHDLTTQFLDSDTKNLRRWAETFERIRSEKPDDEHDSYVMASPLYYAALLNLIPSLKTLYQRNSSLINMTGGYYGTALQAACAVGHQAVATILLEWGANADANAGAHGSALGASAFYGREELVLTLLNRNVTIDQTSSSGNTPLFSAALRGYHKVVRLLVDRGADTSIANNDGRTPLRAASADGHIEVVQILLEKNPDVDGIDNFGWTPLHTASFNNHVEILRLLLEKNADINKFANTCTPLFGAANNGNADAVRLLLEKNADINRSSDGYTPLFASAHNGHLKVVQILLERSPDIDKSEGNHGWSPLYAAASNGHVEIVRLLLEKNADVGKPRNGGVTALHAAAANGHLEVTRLLIEKNAQIDKSDKDGWTPLHATVFRGHVDVVKLLLENNANAMIPRNDEVTPLHSAAHFGFFEIARLLVEKSVDINKSDENGWTPLHVAVFRDRIDVVKLLLEKEADTMIPRNDGVTALHSAAHFGFAEIARLLIEKNADINKSDDNDWTPLRVAIFRGRTDVVRLLVENNVDVRKGRSASITPLHDTASSGNLEATRLALEKIAEIDELSDTRGILALLDSQGRSVIHLAAKSGNVETLDYLLSNGALPDIKDSFGRALLDYASISGSHKMIERVLEIYGLSNITMGSNSAWSPLHWVCRKGSQESLKLLMEAGIQSSWVETEEPAVRWSLLDIAVYWGNIDLSHYIPTILGSEYKLDHTPTSIDINRANNLKGQENSHEQNCDGCNSAIFGIRFQCRRCPAFNYCIMCKHESSRVHPHHSWEHIEALTKG